MIRKLFGFAVALALPTILAAQAPQIPNEEHASQTAKDKVAQHRATQRRGEVAGGIVHRPGFIAIPPVGRVGPGTAPVAPPMGTPPFKAVPAQPEPPQKPASPGQSGSHRP